MKKQNANVTSSILMPYYGFGAKTALVLGHAENGKGTVAAALADATGRQTLSTSLYMADVLFKALTYAGVYNLYGFDRFYEDRKEYRDMWAGFIACYCRDDKARFLREIVACGYEITDGVRRPDELYAGLGEGIFDLLYWVDAGDRKPKEQTMEIDLTKLIADPRRCIPLVHLDNSAPAVKRSEPLAGIRILEVYDAN